MTDESTSGPGGERKPVKAERKAAGKPGGTSHLRVVSEHVPPPSQANTTLVTIAAGVAAIAGIAFAVFILADFGVTYQGAALAIALLSLGVAVRRFFTDTYSDVEAVEDRTIGVDEEPGAPISDISTTGRRPFLRNVLVGSAGVVGVSTLAAVPSLGPQPSGELARTRWAPGMRLVDTTGEPIRPEDVAGGGIQTVWPEGNIGHERSSVILVRLSGEQPRPPTNLDWVVDDRLVAYSKVCTHAGCPVGLFREQDDALFCPCHQSTFDANRGAVPTFGPTARALPQLPMEVDAEGFLVATGDFEAQVGPAYG